MRLVKKLLGKSWLGPIIGLIFIYLAFRNFRYDEFASGLQKFQLLYLVPIIGTILLTYVIKGLRWRYILNHVKSIPVFSAFQVILIGQMGNSLLPARFGDFLRAYVIASKENIGKSLSFASVVLERVIDGFILIAFITASIFILKAPSWVKLLILLSLIIFGTALLLLVLSAYRFYRLPPFIKKMLPDRWTDNLGAIRAIFLEFTRGLQILRDGKQLAAVFAISFVIWILESVMYFMMFKAFSVELPFYASMFVLGIANLAAAIPSLPGFIGTYHYSFTLALLVFGISQSEGLVYATTLHGIGYIFVVLTGLYFMSRLSFKPEIPDFFRAFDTARSGQVMSSHKDVSPEKTKNPDNT